jgi:hypothetical protein
MGNYIIGTCSTCDGNEKYVSNFSSKISQILYEKPGVESRITRKRLAVICMWYKKIIIVIVIIMKEIFCHQNWAKKLSKSTFSIHTADDIPVKGFIWKVLRKYSSVRRTIEQQIIMMMMFDKNCDRSVTDHLKRCSFQKQKLHVNIELR